MFKLQDGSECNINKNPTKEYCPSLWTKMIVLDATSTMPRKRFDALEFYLRNSREEVKNFLSDIVMIFCGKFFKCHQQRLILFILFSTVLTNKQEKSLSGRKTLHLWKIGFIKYGDIYKTCYYIARNYEQKYDPRLRNAPRTYSSESLQRKIFLLLNLGVDDHYTYRVEKNRKSGNFQ